MVNGVFSITVDKGEIVAIIGSNGVSKSTLLKTIAGLKRPKSGTISLLGEDVTVIYADEIARHGAVLVPEGPRSFPDLTVRDNLRLGGLLSRRFGRRRDRYRGDGVVLSHSCR